MTAHETCPRISAHSLPCLRCSFCSAVLPTEWRGFSTSLDRLTTALQINSNVRRSFQPFATTWLKVMMNNYRKMFWNIFLITISGPAFSWQLLKSFLQALSSSEGPKECRAGLSRSRKAVFPGYILTFSPKFTGWPKASKLHHLYPSGPVPEQQESLYSVKRSRTHWQKMQCKR